MKNQLKFLGLAAIAISSQFTFAQSAGDVMVRAGFGTISPNVNSGNLSAPSFAGSKSDVGPASSVMGGVTYMLTDNMSVDIPVAIPFKHKLYGAGAIASVGQIGEVSALPVTVFGQYRFMQAASVFRPYVGLGLTYAYFFNETGSGALTSITNPGGTPTKIKIDSQWTYTAQIGATYAIDKNWFVDGFYGYTPLKTTTKLSTGQTVDVTLDPNSYGLAIGYKF